MDNVAFTYKDKDIAITASKEAIDNFDISVKGNSISVQPKFNLYSEEDLDDLFDDSDFR